MTSFHERLKEAREAAGFKSAAAAVERFGWKGSTYYGHENGSRGVDIETAEGYAKAFKVPAAWLLLGYGAASAGLAEPEPQQFTALIPVYDVSASAGDGAVVEYEPIADQLAFPRDYLKKLTKSNPRNLAIISVKGDSMEPTLKDDDIVLLDASKTSLHFDGLFVLRFGDALHVKRVTRSARQGFITILSDNSTYPPQEHAAGDVAVIGKVLWYGRKV